MQLPPDNKNSAPGKKPSDYDFFQGVFEWIFYNLPPKADNTFIRNMYEFYKTRGGLSIKQMQALLKTIDYIGTKPPFNPATIEAIIKKKAVKTPKKQSEKIWKMVRRMPGKFLSQIPYY